MHPDLKAVIEVQQLDQQVAELTVQIDSLPKQIQNLQSQLDDFIHTHEERKKRLAANLKERKDLEGEIKVVQEKITKHKDQLYQVKTNDQYRAMLKEIEGEEGNIRAIEDQILEKMIEAEDIQKHVQEAAARLEGEKARVAAEIKRLQDERQKDLDERERLQVRRKEVAGALSESVLALYERIRTYRTGAAVAEVRDGLCTACNVRLRPQIYNEVRGNEAVLTCENCSRIIYSLEDQPSIRVAYDSDGLRIITVTRADLEEIKSLELVDRDDWPVTFSTNADGEIWPFVGYGLSSGEERKCVQGLSRILDIVAKAYRSDKPRGGRFFMNEEGAFYRDEREGAPAEPLSTAKRIAKFVISEGEIAAAEGSVS